MKLSIEIENFIYEKLNQYNDCLKQDDLDFVISDTKEKFNVICDYFYIGHFYNYSRYLIVYVYDEVLYGIEVSIYDSK